jgi:hypothetical protein
MFSVADAVAAVGVLVFTSCRGASAAAVLGLWQLRVPGCSLFWPEAKTKERR